MVANATTAEPGWPALVDRFLEDLREEDRSEHTRRNYRDDLLQFAAWYRGRYGEDPELGRLAKRDVLEWRDEVKAKGGRRARAGDPAREAKVSTVNRKVAALRSFFRWAAEHDLGVRFDPPKPRKKEGSREPRSLTDEQRKALIRAVEDSHDTRDILLIRAGLDGGLRVAEMAGLKWSMVHITERKGSMTVVGKGEKPRTVGLTKPLRYAFLEHGYQRHRGKDKPVFDGPRGGLSIRGIQDIIERHLRRARVGKQVGIEGASAHSLRHTCADFLLNHPDPDKRLSVPEVAEILGHSDIKTTMIYVRPQKGRLSDRMAAIDD
jgi:integrase/recombinase XerC